MASNPPHEPSATSSRRNPQKKRKRPSSASPANPPLQLSSLSVVNPPYATQAEIQEVVAELKQMELYRLVMQPWSLKHEGVCKEFLEYDTGRRVYRGENRLKTVVWDSPATFARVYGLPAEGASLADLDVDAVQQYFEGAPGKDGYFLKECTNEKLRKLLRVLNPILVPKRSNQVPQKIVAAVATSLLSPESKVNWAKILCGVFQKLVSGSETKTYRCFLSPYLFHVYREFMLLSSDEQEHLKLSEESYFQTGRDLSEDTPEVTSFADKFQANPLDWILESCSYPSQDGEDISVRASSNHAASSIFSREDFRVSYARRLPGVARDVRGSFEDYQRSIYIFLDGKEADVQIPGASLNHSETSEFQQQRTGTEPAVVADPSSSAFAGPEQSTEVGGREIWYPSTGPSSGVIRDVETSVPKEPAIASSSRTQDRMADRCVATSRQTYDEGAHLKLSEESYFQTGRDLSEDAPEVTSFADKFQANPLDLEAHSYHLQDGEDISVRASSNHAASSSFSREDYRGSNARLLPLIARDFHGTLQDPGASLNHSETSEFQQQRTGTEPAVVSGPSSSAFADPEQSTEVGGREIRHPATGPSSGLIRDVETSVLKEPAIASSSRTQDCVVDRCVATSRQTYDEGAHRANRKRNIDNACKYITTNAALWMKDEEEHRRQESETLQAEITQKEGEITALKASHSILSQQFENLRKKILQQTEKLDPVKENTNRTLVILERST